ncbi:hypothetical protein P1X15_06485 [Runella sp. MFBS21]|uniref:hypothetical protein n=1 Tax=Runella sp. MFBS21 TaxID=3034018 RepID=UPI0023F7B183|nr:hypothetical protein [Runella sp. MFBS21]MDF7817235.1 hypothetical protein [Runella sp. MFBS21]
MNRYPNYRRRFWLFPAFAIIAVLVLGGVVQWLWNAILPALLGVSFISFWQAVGLLVLCRILFGNFGRGFGSRSSQHFQKRNPWREKWANMNDEERTKFKEEWRKRCGR